jgi:hypothetical protein
MGGVGKTQIAIEYLYRYRDCYKAIYWISGADQQSLFSGFQEIGSIANCLPRVAEMNPTDLAKSVLSWLRLQEDWLIVIDNVDDFSVVDGYLPDLAPPRHTIITTRNPDATRFPAEGIEIPIFDEEDAIALLRIRSNTENSEYPTTESSTQSTSFASLAISHSPSNKPQLSFDRR